MARTFNIFYSWQSDLPGDKTRYFIRDCIDEAIELALHCEAIEAQRDEATLGTTGAPNIVTTLFSKIDECDLFVADLSLCFTKEQGEKKSPNPNVMLELGYAVKTLGWDRIICICNTDYGNNYPFDIAQQRITAFSLKGKNHSEVKAQISKIIFKNIRDLRDSVPRAKFGMASHIVGAYDSDKHEIVRKLIPECIEEKKLYRHRNEIILLEAKKLLDEIRKTDIRKAEDAANHYAGMKTAVAPTIAAQQIELSDAIKQFTESLNESLKVTETPVIITDKDSMKKGIEFWLKTKVTDSFFDLGGLKNRTSRYKINPVKIVYISDKYLRIVNEDDEGIYYYYKDDPIRGGNEVTDREPHAKAKNYHDILFYLFDTLSSDTAHTGTNMVSADDRTGTPKLMSKKKPEKANESSAMNRPSLRNLQTVPQNKVIQSPVSARILVNAGPGTGKTWTLIERIIKLVQDGTEPDTVQVLCFSRAAVDVVRKRMAEAISEGRVDPMINLVDIRTFDSFASQLLYWVKDSEYSEIGKEFQIEKLNYEERIELFIKVLKKQTV